jgi:hypothetical protein
MPAIFREKLPETLPNFERSRTAGFYFLNSPLLKGVEPRRELAPVRVDNPSTLRGIGLGNFANCFYFAARRNSPATASNHAKARHHLPGNTL